MSVRLNHTIVWCRDKVRSADFLTAMLGLPPAKPFLHFLVVETANGVSLDFFEKQGSVSTQHYAFLVEESDFDAIHARLLERALPYWADPARQVPGEINRHDGGRGVYFQDPDGHLLEAITRPYGSGAAQEEEPAT
ncbi:MAG: VOC family protein [Tistlia sp.]|uniref:VOC family protein n=1 Tax=Tistlia sp. TaxID=3057121 RepID=UPI0034A3071C